MQLMGQTVKDADMPIYMQWLMAACNGYLLRTVAKTIHNVQAIRSLLTVKSYHRQSYCSMLFHSLRSEHFYSTYVSQITTPAFSVLWKIVRNLNNIKVKLQYDKGILKQYISAIYNAFQ